MKPKKFPLTVRRGSATVKIYRESKPSGHYFRVSFYKGSVCCGLNFSDLDAARHEAEAKAAQLSRGDIEAMTLSRLYAEGDRGFHGFHGFAEQERRAPIQPLGHQMVTLA